MGNSIQSIMIKDPKQNNIFLLFKNKIDKIYPEEDKDRFVLDIKDNIVSGKNMKISGGIKHKVINCEKDEFAKITITNHM
ncbi:MAG: hypothetical protein J4F36_11900 [Nitrosopumilaceae archaeon]|nr:hypothetical protein [Nitrosopumilaceae archaeon]